MGKNYYGYKKLTEAEKKINIEAMANDDYTKFISPQCYHVGKSALGWKFCFNRHDGEFFNDKDSFIEYLKSLYIVDQHDEHYSFERFIEEVSEIDKMYEKVGDDEMYYGYRFSQYSEFF